MTPETLPPEAQIMKIILGKWISKPVYIATALEIPDILADGEKTIKELSAITDTHSDSLYRLMRALCSVGIFKETDNGYFKNSPLSECLMEGHLKAATLLFHSSWHDRMWENLMYSIRTGRSSFEELFGEPVFDWFKTHPAEAKLFHQANSFKAATSHRALLDVYDFKGIRHVTDVGGGLGGLMFEVINAYPGIKGTIAESPETVALLTDILEDSPIKDQLIVTECDFFNNVPSGSDAYLLSHILHDWPDSKCITLLKNCRKAMGPDGKLIVLESVIQKGNSFSISKFLDLEVLLMGGSRERSANEFTMLMAQSGFRISKIISTPQDISVIEAVPE